MTAIYKSEEGGRAVQARYMEFLKRWPVANTQLRVPTRETDVPRAYQPFADFVSLIFRNFRPRRERVPLLSDEALKRLTIPVMLIVGGRDVLLDSEGSRRRLERWAPCLTLRFLPEDGHYLRGQTIPILEFLRARPAA